MDKSYADMWNFTKIYEVHQLVILWNIEEYKKNMILVLCTYLVYGACILLKNASSLKTVTEVKTDNAFA